MKKLPVGLSDFKRVIEDDYYYVDKSLLIKELIEQGAQALLLPRPRRFGKTLNLSMLRYFFEKSAEDTSALFRHLQIWQAGETYTRRQGKHPVIFMSFKDAKAQTWEECLGYLQEVIRKEYKRHDYLLDKNILKKDEQGQFARIINSEAEVVEYAGSLSLLSEHLARYHQQKVMLLIDEYDTPIQAGYVNGYYAEVIGFMRNFLSGGLKDNVHLEKGVLTGIMRVAKESIFSGLNNLAVFTLLRSEFSTGFGLTESEVEQALVDFDLVDHQDKIKKWYNGYVFGDRIVYNPWSIINYLNSADKEFRPYWVNTSDNAVIEQLLTRGGVELKAELENLVRGESIEKPIREDVVFKELETKEDLLWSFLLFSGYLKQQAQRPGDFDPAELWCRLVVPNLEVRSLYVSIVQNWFSRRMENRKLETMLHALIHGDLETFEDLFAELVNNTFSFWDTAGQDAEKVYQAFALGMLIWLAGRYEVKSNRESGFGRYDVMLIPKDQHTAGLIIEFKKINARRGETKESSFAKAFQQIEDKNYAAELQARGVQTIRKMAVVFEGKQVWVEER